jgi:hypothetical protein
MASTETSKNIKLLNGGSLDGWWGPYASAAAACAAIPNQEGLIDGVPVNFRQGKRVGINTALGVISMVWRNGYLDSNLVEESVIPEKFRSALETELLDTFISTKYGTELLGLPEDAVGIRFRFNETIDSIGATPGTLTEIRFYLGTAGTIGFCIGTFDGTYFTKRKSLPEINGAVGLNTIVYSEAILANEIVSIDATTTFTAKIKYGYGGSLPGTRFIQAGASVLAPAFGAAGSYYAYGFTVARKESKPSDVLLRIANFGTYGYTRSQAETAFIAKGQGFTDQVQIEIDRITYGTLSFGPDLIGGGVDNPNGYKFNEPASKSTKNGLITNLYINLASAGTISFAIVTNNGTSLTLIKELGSFNGVIGANTFNMGNEPILENQYVVIRTGTSTIKFGSGLPVGNNFVQGKLSGTGTNVNGGSGTYYSYKYDIAYVLPKPLDTFAKKTDLLVYAKQADIDSKILANNQGYSLRQIAYVANNGQALNGATFSNNLNTINIPVGVTGGSSYFAFSTVDIDPNFNTVNNLKRLHFDFLYKITGTLLGSVSVFPVGATGLIPTTVLLYTSGDVKWYRSSFEIDVVSGMANVRPALQFVNSSTNYNSPLQVDLLEKSFYGVTDSNTTPATLKTQFDSVIESKIAAAINAYAASLPPAGVIVTITKIVKKNGTVGVDCDFNGNRGIQNAIESITDASAYKRYEIVVDKGSFEALAKSDVTAGVIAPSAEQTGANMVAFVRGKSFVSLRGVDRDSVIIRLNMPPEVPTNTYQYYQTMYWHSDQGTIENVTIIGKNARYPVHIDGGQLGCKNFYSAFKNCKFIHQGNPNNTGVAGEWNSGHGVGTGMSDGQVLEFLYCYFEAAFDLFYHHTNLNFAKGSKVVYRNCYGINIGTNKIAYNLQSLGSGKQDIVEFYNTKTSNAYIFSIDDNPYIPTALKDQNYNHNDFRIFGSGNDPFVCRTNFFGGHALKITSKNGGASSIVRFDFNSSAFLLLVKDKDYLSGSYTTDLNEVNENGYAYKDGSGSVFGYAIGRLDIGSYPCGLQRNVYIKSLGKRLGDCSVVNKTLGIIIDGTTYNVVFNKNYNGTDTATPSTYSNGQILAEINAVIGAVATASEYNIANDYFPEFSDVNQIFKSAEIIEKGMVVVADSGVIRKALSTDEKITGVALDDVIPNNYARVYIKGYVDGNTGFPFSIKQEAYVATLKGEKFGISATAGKISKTAIIKHLTCFENGILSFNI